MRWKKHGDSRINGERAHAGEPVKYSMALKKPQIQPPEMMGSVKLSSNDPRSAEHDDINNRRQTRAREHRGDVPRASAVPEISPLTTPRVVSPSQRPRGRSIC